MFIIIGSDGNEYGPADATTIKSWISGGRATLQTKARRADSSPPPTTPEWKPLADFPEFASAAAQQPPPIPNEARTTPVTIDAKAFAAALIARAKPLDIGSCISRGWTFYKSDFWAIFGVTLVANLIMGAVPIVGVALGMGGLYYYYLGKMRGHPRQLSDIFVGLSRMTAPLIIGTLALIGLVYAVMLAALLLGVMLFLIVHALAPQAGIVLGILVSLAGLVCFAAVAYLSVTFSFMFPLIIDKNLNWRDAMTVSRRVIHAQFWPFLGLMLLLWVLSFVGLLMCYVGAFFVAPLLLAAIAYAYEDLCNPPKQN